LPRPRDYLGKRFLLNTPNACVSTGAVLERMRGLPVDEQRVTIRAYLTTLSADDLETIWIVAREMEAELALLATLAGETVNTRQQTGERTWQSH